MIIRSHVLKVSQNVPAYNLYTISDLHIGSENFMPELWQEWRNRVKKDKNALVAVVGDIVDDDRPSTRLARKVMYNDRNIGPWINPYINENIYNSLPAPFRPDEICFAPCASECAR